MADDTVAQNTQDINDNTTAVNTNSQAVSDATRASIEYNRIAVETSRTNKDVSSSFEIISNFIDSSREKFDDFEKTLETVGIQLDKTTTLSQGQIAAFGAIEAATLGASKAYDSMIGISTANLNTFTSQINALGDRITTSPLFHYGELLAQQSGKTGASSIAAFAKEFVANFAQSADQAIKLENAVFQLSAKTGMLGDVQKAAGPNLQNVNALVEQQNRIVQQSANYFQISSAEVANFYTQLGTVKGAVDANVSGTGKLGDTVSGLTAAMLLAKGSGRDFKDIVDDMKSALDNYNITGEEALQFTARMTEISNKFNVQIEDVRSSLVGVSDRFSIFGKEAEGAARLYNSYLGALEGTGISGHQAVNIIGGLTEGIKSLSIAQKSFLSSQTGGPGGLLGGFQIEKELRDGNIDKVFDRVRQSLGKQFGKIVNLEEASQSQAAAQQLEKQILLLQQGPLGKFVQDPQSAMRVLESFRAKDEGKPAEDLNKDFLQKTMETGDDISKQTNTLLGGMARTLEQIRDQASFSNLGTVQTILTAGSGNGALSPDTQETRTMRMSLSDDMRKANEASAAAARDFRESLSVGKVTADRDSRASDIGKSLSEITKTPNKIKESTSSTVSGLSQLFTNGSKENTNSTVSGLSQLFGSMTRENAEKQKAQYLEELNRAKDKAQKQINDPKELTNTLESFFSKENNINEAFSKTLNEKNTVNSAFSRALSTTNTTANSARLGADVKRIASQSNQINQPNTSNDLSSPAHKRHDVTNDGKLGEITVHVEGYCIRCKSEMEAKSQSHAVNPASKLP